MLLKFRGLVVVWGEGRLRDPPDPSLPSLWRTEGDASQQERLPNSDVHGAHKKPDTANFGAANAETSNSIGTSFD